MAETELKEVGQNIAKNLEQKVEQGGENIVKAAVTNVEQGGENLVKAAAEHVKQEGEELIEQVEEESPTLGSRLKKFFMSYLKLDVTKIEELHNLIINIIPKSRNKRIAALLISLATLIGGLVTIIKLTEYYTVKPKHKYAIKNGKLVKR